MLTINDVQLKINDMSNKYFRGTPRIHVNRLSAELQATKEEVLPHLDELDKQGVITFHATLHDIFSLSQKVNDEGKGEVFGNRTQLSHFNDRED